MSRSPDSTCLHLDAERVRLYVETWRFTALGDESSEQSRIRVLEALERLEAAARKEAA